MLDSDAIMVEASAQFTNIIKNGHDAPEFFGHSAYHLINQNLSTADAHRVDDVTDNRTSISD